jgi:hypothetical protein
MIISLVLELAGQNPKAIFVGQCVPAVLVLEQAGKAARL